MDEIVDYKIQLINNNHNAGSKYNARRRSIINNKRIKYIYDTNDTIYHDKDCELVPEIMDNNFCGDEYIPEKKRMCFQCQWRVYIRMICGEDYKHYERYRRFFSEGKVHFDTLKRIIDDNDVEIFMEHPNILRIRCNEDTWKIIAMENDRLLLHNNYVMTSSVDRYITQGFHRQNIGTSSMTRMMEKIGSYKWYKHLEGKFGITQENMPVLIGEDDYEYRMNGAVDDFLVNQMDEGMFKSFDGKEIHYYTAINPKEQASIVISHGFCEFFGKYYEMAYYFYKVGYSVFFIEHRGHGYSYREVNELDKVHINSYNEYVEDLHQFMQQIVCVKSRTRKYQLLGHSMGGAISALFLEQYPHYFTGAVLSSPLMTINLGTMPEILARGYLTFMTAAGKVFPSLKYHLAPGQCRFSAQPEYKNSCAQSEPRYNYIFSQRVQVPHYQTYGATCSWTRASIKACKSIRANADKVHIPVLICQAGKDTLVKPEGHEAFIKKAENARLKVFPSAKHEIYNSTEEVRREYYYAIIDFFRDSIAKN